MVPDRKMADGKTYTRDRVVFYLVEVKPSIPLLEDDVNRHPVPVLVYSSDSEDINLHYVDSISVLKFVPFRMNCSY